MNDLHTVFRIWREALRSEVQAGSVIARNPLAHRWKATTRSVVFREATAWRTHDLLSQAVYLYEGKHLLGARILVRSAIETVAVLTYLNQITRKVVSGDLDFFDFSKRTAQLLLGSKDGSTSQSSINIITILEKVERRIPGISKVYASLSESAHPNYEGTANGYGIVDQESFAAEFKNRWSEKYAEGFESYVRVTAHLYQHEYDFEWIEAFEALESWLENNHESLVSRSAPAA